MCSTNGAGAALLQYGMKVPNPSPYMAALHPGMTQTAFELHRAQLYDYNARLQYGLRAYPGIPGLPFPHHQDALAHAYLYKHDPRVRFMQEEPKPSHSYIGLIAMAILSHKEHKLVLSDIYQWILDNYAYFRTRGPGWRNSIRHNLSLNDCFIKSGRSANGKGHYWAIHPANIDDFKKGDFRRRRAQRRVRKHMGLAVPDDEDSPSPPPTTAADILEWQRKMLTAQHEDLSPNSDSKPGRDSPPSASNVASPHEGLLATKPTTTNIVRKRLFDVESLLAPDGHSKCVKLNDRDIIEKDVASHKDKEDSDVEDDSQDSVIEVGSEQEAIDMSSDRDLEHGRVPDHRESPEVRLGSANSSPTTERPDHSPRHTSHSLPSSPPVPSDPRVAAVWPGAAAHMGLPSAWPDHPSAFHNATPATMTAWSTLPSHGYPIMSAPFPLPPAVAGTAAETAQRWQEAFARIMSKSYEKNVKLEV